MSDDVERRLEDIEAMFAQTAREMTTDGDRVTFHGLSPAALFFSDRPERVVGHLSSRQFVDLWGEGENSFAADPPNAVISLLDADDETLEGDKITYTVKVLESSLPAKGESCSVFIDPFGRPLSPVSVAGMNRRARRRRR